MKEQTIPDNRMTKAVTVWVKSSSVKGEGPWQGIELPHHRRLILSSTPPSSSIVSLGKGGYGYEEMGRYGGLYC